MNLGAQLKSLTRGKPVQTSTASAYKAGEWVEAQPAGSKTWRIAVVKTVNFDGSYDVECVSWPRASLALPHSFTGLSAV